MSVSLKTKKLATVYWLSQSIREQIKPAFGPCLESVKKTLDITWIKWVYSTSIFNQRFGESTLPKDAERSSSAAYEATVKAGIEVVAQPTSMLYLWKKVKTGHWRCYHKTWSKIGCFKDLEVSVEVSKEVTDADIDAAYRTRT